MKQTFNLLKSSMVILTVLLFSGCSKVSITKSDEQVSYFSFKNKSTEQLQSDEILKYSINDKASTSLVFDKQVIVNLKKDFTNNLINIKIWVENSNGVVLSNISNLIVTKEIYLAYKTASIKFNRNSALRTTNGNSDLLPGNGLIIISGVP